MESATAKARSPVWLAIIACAGVLVLAHVVCAGSDSTGKLNQHTLTGSGNLVCKSPDAELPKLSDNRVSGPYCGIYSLYVCLSALGIETNPRDYVSTKYIGSSRGSNAKELIDAAKDFGVHTECFSHLTHRELRRVQTPTLLHVRSSWADADFNHWVAFFGWDGDRVRIIDAPHSLQTISMAELLANWDGSAIAVSKEAVDQTFVFDGRIDYLLECGLFLLAIYALRKMFASNTQLPSNAFFQFQPKTLALQIGAILGISFLLGVGYHALSDVGFLENPTALAEVTRRYYSLDIPEISLADIKHEISEGHSLVVDARHVIDYRHGALPGAKNMSVDSTLSERQEALAGVSKDKRIIVYCQSAGCSYADKVADFLKFNGYTNLAIFRDGYKMWHQAHAPAEDATSHSVDIPE